MDNLTREQILNFILSLKPEDRLEILGELASNFCLNCGETLGSKAQCYCHE